MKKKKMAFIFLFLFVVTALFFYGTVIRHSPFSLLTVSDDYQTDNNSADNNEKMQSGDHQTYNPLRDENGIGEAEPESFLQDNNMVEKLHSRNKNSDSG